MQFHAKKTFFVSTTQILEKRKIHSSSGEKRKKTFCINKLHKKCASLKEEKIYISVLESLKQEIFKVYSAVR